MKHTIWVAALLVGAGCNVSLDDILPSKGGCTVASAHTCVDYTGTAWSTPSSGSRACAAVGNGATFSSAACPTAGRVGSCVLEHGQASEAVTRFYAPNTTASAQAVCGQASGSVFAAN